MSGAADGQRLVSGSGGEVSPQRTMGNSCSPAGSFLGGRAWTACHPGTSPRRSLSRPSTSERGTPWST